MRKMLNFLLVSKYRGWILLSLYLLPLAIVCYLGFRFFGDFPMSKEAPSWGDFIGLIGAILSLVTFILIYTSLEQQELDNQLNVVDHFINDAVSYVNNIEAENSKGVKAIVEYGKKYSARYESEHPRIVVDSLCYLVSQLKFYILILNRIGPLEKTKGHFIKLCLFFYHHLYHSVGVDMTNPDCFTAKLEREYIFFVKDFKDLQCFTYTILKSEKLIQEHNESNHFCLESCSDKDLEVIRLKVLKR